MVESLLGDTRAPHWMQPKHPHFMDSSGDNIPKMSDIVDAINKINMKAGDDLYEGDTFEGVGSVGGGQPEDESLGLHLSSGISPNASGYTSDPNDTLGSSSAGSGRDTSFQQSKNFLIVGIDHLRSDSVCFDQILIMEQLNYHVLEWKMLQAGEDFFPARLFQSYFNRIDLFCSRCWIIASVCCLLWQLKATLIAAPDFANMANQNDIPFVREIWDLNQIRHSPVLSPMPVLNAYIARFNLDNSYRTLSKSTEEFFSNIIREIAFFGFLMTEHIPTLKYGPCPCTPTETVVQAPNQPVPVLNIAYGDVRNMYSIPLFALEMKTVFSY